MNQGSVVQCPPARTMILAAQDSDAHINKVAPDLFKAFPNMKSLARATEDTLHPLLSKVRNFGNKTRWLMRLATEVKDDKNIPFTMVELTALPGIGLNNSLKIFESHSKPLV